MELKGIFTEFDQQRQNSIAAFEARLQARNERKTKFINVVYQAVIPFVEELVSLARQRRMEVVADNKTNKDKEAVYKIRFESAYGIPALNKQNPIECAVYADEDYDVVYFAINYGVIDPKNPGGRPLATRSYPLDTVTLEQVKEVLTNWAKESLEILAEA